MKSRIVPSKFKPSKHRIGSGRYLPRVTKGSIRFEFKLTLVNRGMVLIVTVEHYWDGRIVEDGALGIYPNSVYALYTCI